MLVQQFLTTSAKKTPQKVALVVDGKRWTYAQIEERSNRLARFLATEAGLARGQRVAIYLPNQLETVESIFAVLKAGGVFVVINISTKEEKPDTISLSNEVYIYSSCL